MNTHTHKTNYGKDTNMTNKCKDRDVASMCYANSEEAEAADTDYIIPLRESIPNSLAKPKKM